MSAQARIKLTIGPLILLYILLFSTSSLAESFLAEPKSITLRPGSEFTFIQPDHRAFKLAPLREELRSINTLTQAEAVGVIHLGGIRLAEQAEPMNALRDIAYQISNGLGLDMALITDSATSKEFAPHELLLLYHPKVIITLTLAYSAETESYDLIGSYAAPKNP